MLLLLRFGFLIFVGKGTLGYRQLTERKQGSAKWEKTMSF